MNTAIVVSIGVAGLLSLLLTRRFANPGSRLHILDHPNRRSLHTRATPRSGGVAIVIGIIIAMAGVLQEVKDPAAVPWLMAALVLVALVSWIDDVRGVSVVPRLAAHLVASAIVVAGFGGVFAHGESLAPGSRATELLMVAAATVGVAWYINLYNFMDGIDGLAGGMAVFGFGFFSLAGLDSGNILFAAISLVAAAAAAGFLVWNFPPARIFMGDTGSATLGLLAGSLTLWGYREGVFSLLVGILVFSPFVVDATATLILRGARGERVWQAHRSHYYQRLVQCGWSHRRTALAEYSLMLACGGTAMVIRAADERWQWIALAVWAVTYSVLIWGIHRLEKKSTK